MPSGRGTHIDLLGLRPEAGGKASPPSGFSCLFKTSRVLGRRKAQVKRWVWFVSDPSCPCSFQFQECFFIGPPSQPHCHSGFGVKKEKVSCSVLESLDLLPSAPPPVPSALCHCASCFHECPHLGMLLPPCVHTHTHEGGCHL